MLKTESKPSYPPPQPSAKSLVLLDGIQYFTHSSLCTHLSPRLQGAFGNELTRAYMVMEMKWVIVPFVHHTLGDLTFHLQGSQEHMFHCFLLARAAHLAAQRNRSETVNIKFFYRPLLGANLFHQNGLTEGAATSLEIRSPLPES